MYTHTMEIQKKKVNFTLGVASRKNVSILPFFLPTAT